jgi:hypothetical protein
MAAQLMGTNGPARRGDRSCRRRAITSLPEPLSPTSVTVTSLAATAHRIRSNSRITGDWVTGSITIAGVGIDRRAIRRVYPLVHRLRSGATDPRHLA